MILAFAAEVREECAKRVEGLEDHDGPHDDTLRITQHLKSWNAACVAAATALRRTPENYPVTEQDWTAWLQRYFARTEIDRKKLLVYNGLAKSLSHILTRAVEQERERCTKIVADEEETFGPLGVREAKQHILATIREVLALPLIFTKLLQLERDVCCLGANPACAGGCLVEKNALARMKERDALAAQVTKLESHVARLRESLNKNLVHLIGCSLFTTAVMLAEGHCHCKRLDALAGTGAGEHEPGR